MKTTPLRLEVLECRHETPLIRRMRLRSADGGVWPRFDAGAHITVLIPGIGRRKYSLVRPHSATAGDAGPQEYTLGVRLDAAGGGGSRWMHALRPGDTLEAESPANDFMLGDWPGGAIFVAGGIGVTPLVSMAAQLAADGRPFRFVYAVRTRDELAFLPELSKICGTALSVHVDAEKGGLLDVRALLASANESEQVYVCGPKPMLQVALREARALRWAPDRLRFELFYSAGGATAPPAAAPARADTFEVVIKSSGKVFTVPPDKSILAVLLEAGLDPLYDCNKGECGVCQVGVVEGVPDHKDVILSEAEKRAGKTMQICVSRAKSAKLVLDL